MPTHIKDITGQRFGQLMALESTIKDRYGRAIWLCQCTCGKLTQVPGHYLRRGSYTMCYTCAMAARLSNPTNIIGGRFGGLTVQSLISGTKYNDYRYTCLCDCGKEVQKSGAFLLHPIVKKACSLRCPLFQGPNKKRKRVLTPEELRTMYNAGQTLADIAVTQNVSASVVSRWLKADGTPTRLGRQGWKVKK